MERLEEIAGKMESGELSLEELLNLHQEGMTLAAELKQRLEKASQALKVVSEGEEGEIALTDFPLGGEA